MKCLTLFPILILTACVTHQQVDRQRPDMRLAYRDLALDTATGRAALAARVAQAAASFCRTYDPTDGETRFHIGLANPHLCPGVASIMLTQRMPARVRRAYQAGRRGE